MKGSITLADRRRHALALLDDMIHRRFPGRIAVSSSFGTEAAVLLDLVAAIDRRVPILFLDTGLLPPETLAYRDHLIALLGLGNVRRLGPDPADLATHDPRDRLHRDDPERCCDLRKVRPLDRVLVEFKAWITGRKRHHGGERGELAEIEFSDGRTKINPLADWPETAIAQAFAARDLPPHPLLACGYASIGCGPCSQPTEPGEPVRAGRWRGRAKTECGIHRPAKALSLPFPA